MSYTLKRAVTGSGKEIKIDFDRALVSMGTLMPIFKGTATQNGNKMYFNWQDNSGMGNAEDTKYQQRSLGSSTVHLDCQDLFNYCLLKVFQLMIRGIFRIFH